MPQRPGQGSWHFLLMQALSVGQSAFTTHSGRQLGGDPIISGRQEHWHLSPIRRGGLLFGPQGFGSHGSSATTGSIAVEGVVRPNHANMLLILTYGLPPACCERVSYVPLNARAGRNMVEDPAYGIGPTGARAGVHTVELLACFVRRTVRIYNTFWSACYVGVSKVVRDALAGTSPVSFLTDGVGSTRRGVAWVYHLSRNWH